MNGQWLPFKLSVEATWESWPQNQVLINAWAAPNGFSTGCMQNNEKRMQRSQKKCLACFHLTRWQIFKLVIIFLLFLHRHITITWCKPAVIPCKPLHCLSAQVSLIFLSPGWNRKTASVCLFDGEVQSNNATSQIHYQHNRHAGEVLKRFPKKLWPSRPCSAAISEAPRPRVASGSEIIHLFVWVKRIAHVLLIPLSALMLP